MNSLSIFGTSSDAGKSTLSFAITYLLHHRGISVAPFKAQNVSNNSMVTDSGGEIAIPQYFAAEAIGLKTTPHMNPILLKSGGDGKAHVIINGKSVSNKDVKEYYHDLDSLKPFVTSAFCALKRSYDVIVAEGAGSPVELNLMDKDLSNIFVASEFKTKIILVADIERGGVFASIYGVYNLLPKKLRKNVIGVVINKFRGDISLFDEGRVIIEKQFGLKVLGVVPFKAFNLGFEDAQSLMNYTQNKLNPLIKVGVIQLPHMSNFTDFEPLIADNEVSLHFINTPKELESCDLIILPGSKRVFHDLLWLRERGFERQLQDKSRHIIAICGGYEMMFERLLDPRNIESQESKIEGFARFKGDVTFVSEKIVTKGSYNLLGNMLEGYEIHNGITKKRAKKKAKLYGTFIHGAFDNDIFRKSIFSEIDKEYIGFNFEEFKRRSIKEFAEHIETNIDMNYIVNTL